MRDTVLSIVAFLILVGFLGILLYEVPRVDLGGVIVFTLVLAGYDFLRALRERQSRSD